MAYLLDHADPTPSGWGRQVKHCHIPDGFRFADYPGGRCTPSVIGPRSETYIPVNIAIQDAIAAHERRKRILVYGWLEYNDIFEGSRRHRTEFCYEFEFFTDPRTLQYLRLGSHEFPCSMFSPMSDTMLSMTDVFT